MLWYFHLIRWHAIAFRHEFKTEKRPINIYSIHNIVYKRKRQPTVSLSSSSQKKKTCVMFGVIAVAADVY